MLAEFYAAGGIWMHPVVVWTLVAVGAVVVHAVRRERDMTRLIVASSLVALGFGVLGVLVGAIEAFTAIAAAPPEQRDGLARVGLAIGFNSLVLALFGVLVVAQFAIPVLWLTRDRRSPTPMQPRASEA